VVQKTTRITVETESLIIIRRAKVRFSICPVCGAEVEIIALDDGSFAEPATAVQVREWLAAGRLHRWQTADGQTRICVPSLLHCFG
jgi:hypothetical protein